MSDTQLTPQIIASIILVATIGIVMAVSVYKWLKEMYND